MPPSTKVDDTFEAAKGADKSVLPWKKFDILMPAGEVNSALIKMRGFRGLGVNLPVLSATVGFLVYVSNTPILLGEDGSKMALHTQIGSMIASTTDRQAFSTSFVAEHLYCQLIADATEGLDYTIGISAE